ncbi:hypothetical protein OYC64_012937 [Pagothenia borchgrevinki]|uniref:Ribonuclease A-domain domain-containing protein n=1 Tax=Pagothenia borchgrevinki TaxID=8213 RepID=A0ABD2FSQ1_PAGBO
MRVQVVCLLLVLLSAAVLSLDKKPPNRYLKFKNQHIDKEMSPCGCNKVMQVRKINRIKQKRCKTTNTFILSNDKAVKAICLDQGEPFPGSLTKSLKGFDIVVCEWDQITTPPTNCSYNGRQLENKNIIIKCEKGFPVHYDKDIGHCD